jgi:hypothetical protein
MVAKERHVESADERRRRRNVDRREEERRRPEVRL